MPLRRGPYLCASARTSSFAPCLRGGNVERGVCVPQRTDRRLGGCESALASAKSPGLGPPAGSLHRASLKCGEPTHHQVMAWHVARAGFTASPQLAGPARLEQSQTRQFLERLLVRISEAASIQVRAEALVLTAPV